MNFQKDFDTIFTAILTDCQNQFPEADLSQGSLLFIKGACLASALWGIYKYQDWIGGQIFPDTADSAQLEHHAWVREVSRKPGETDTELLARLLDEIRRPPAGGNQYDYIKWAKAVAGVKQAYCVPLGQGLGTVDVIILGDADAAGSELPSSSARIGVCTSVSAGKLVDSAAAFSDGHAVAVGDIVENSLRQTQTTVSAVDSDTQLALADDLFFFAGEPYIVHCQTGTNTTAAAGKLIDSAGALTDATYSVLPGDIVENVTDGRKSTVVTVDSATQLTLADDIFPAAAKTYLIRGLVSRVKAFIDQARPVTASRVTILPPEVVTQDVTMTLTGTGVDKISIAASIESFLDTLIPGQTLYRAKLFQIAMDGGAENVSITTPAHDMPATAYQMIRPGTITVN